MEYTSQFEAWWTGLSEEEQDKIDASVGLLEKLGPNVPFPHSSGLKSRHGRMRELRVQIHGNPFRILYAFDARRAASLLLGGDKTGDGRWYDVNIPLAEDLYDQHLAALAEERRRKKGSP